MTNNVLYVSDGDYGKRVGYLSAVVQGQYGQVIPLEIRDLANNVVNLTGYSTITGTLNDQRGNVTNIAGTLALDATPSTAPNANWTIAAADFGTPGVFMVMLSFSNGSATLKTIPVALTVHADPAVTAVAGTPLVGVTTAQAALIAAISALTGLVKVAAGSASGVAIQSFMQTFLESATALAARVNILPSYTGNGTKVLAVNSGETDVEWVAQSGGGGAADVTDLTTTTGLPAQRLRVAGAGGLEYRTTEQDLADLQDAGALATTDIGVAVQAHSAKTAAIAALTWAANSIILLTGTATASVQALAAHIVTFIQSASAADARTAIGAGTGNGDLLAANNLSELTATASTARTNLGLGTLATQAGTFSGGGTLATGGFTLTVPATGTAALLATAQTFTAAQTVSLAAGAGTSAATVTNSGASASSLALLVQSTGAGLGLRVEASSSPAYAAWLRNRFSSSTTAIVPALRISNSASGAGGAGFGTSVEMSLKTSTTDDTAAGRMAVLWETATHASRVPDGVFYLTDYGGEREIWRGRANGTAAAIGFLGATPVVRAAHIADPSGGATTDAEARTAINAILVVLENLGFNATS